MGHLRGDIMIYDRFDIVSAHYAFCVDYHEGQWSEKYAKMCRISRYFTPGAGWTGYASLTDNGKMIYDHLQEIE